MNDRKNVRSLERLPDAELEVMLVLWGEGRPMKEGYATTVLHSDKGDRFYGPGHCGEIFKGKDKKEYIFYHCHVEGSRNPNSRPFFIAQIKWDKEGWPYVEGGKPQ